MSLQGLEAESWAPAINLGEVVNTTGNEITPYFSSPFKALVFASNGHIGYGGYDTYLAKGESFFEPEIYNLGDPFNSSHDDIYFNISDTVGFISSNRATERILDINRFRVADEKLFLSLLISGESLIDSRIISRFKDVKLLDLYTFRAEDYEGYELFDPVKREKPKPQVIQEAIEEEQPEVTAEAVAVNESEDEGGEGSGSGESSVQSSDAPLGNAVRRPVADYSTSDYLEMTPNASGLYEHGFEKLYFRYGLSELTSVGTASLDALIEQLSGRSYASVDVLAFSNPKAAEPGNVALSKKRGQVVVDYLVTAGIPQDQIRLLERGLGVNEMRNHWYARVFGRKVEVHINSESPQRFDKAKAYLVRENLTMKQMATLLGVKASDLISWNGFKRSAVTPGTIIRVYGGRNFPSLRYFADEFDARNTFFPYRVKAGENLESIAKKYGTMEELLQEVNKVKTPLATGQRIYVYKINALP
ncbi:MAG: LysM peptidoglycan-binding domain-containing protein, partial [Bacteroidota bacterium]